MELIFQKIAEMLSTDIQTLYKSFLVGSTSTGAGAVAKAANTGWNLEVRGMDLCWALITCIILTLVSLFITDLYKTVKKRICNNKKND